jgi:CRISPR/Cas system-associated exonuclease Cas4 (RecB family)
MTTKMQVTPTAVAELLGGRDYISYSAINTFQQCPLRFYFRYVLGLPEKTIAASLLFGQAMHRAAQFHFEQVLVGNSVSNLDTLLEVFWDAWKSKEPAPVVFNKTEDINAVGKLADRLLRAFLESDFSQPAGTIIGVEEELRGELVPGCPDLLARVDLLIETEDALIVQDFKTSRNAWSHDHVVDSAPQLLLYSELAKSLIPGKTLRLEFAVLAKTKLPSLVMHDVAVDSGQIQRTKRVVQQVWRAIQAGNFYPNPSPLNCPSCPFREPCRVWST